MSKLREVIAVDFDGTLFTDKYPDIGEPKWDVINYIKSKKLQNACIILWTCRNSEHLQNAIDACKEVGLEFDCINSGNPEHIAFYGGNESRKIYADEYIDDHSVNPDAFKKLVNEIDSMFVDHENRYSHLCKTKKECHDETCKYLAILRLHNEFKEFLNKNKVGL